MKELKNLMKKIFRNFTFVHKKIIMKKKTNILSHDLKKKITCLIMNLNNASRFLPLGELLNLIM